MGKTPEGVSDDHVVYRAFAENGGWTVHCARLPDIGANYTLPPEVIVGMLHGQVCKRLGREVGAVLEFALAPGPWSAKNLKEQRREPVRTRADVVRELRAQDVAHLEATVTADIRPAVLFAWDRCDDESLIPVGASHLGGDPDLPQSAIWPTSQGTPLTLLFQLRLSDLPAQDYVDYTGDTSHMLPARGMLWFWYQEHTGIDESRYGELEGAFRVTYHPDESTPLARRPTPSNAIKLHAATPSMWAAPSFVDIDELEMPEWKRYRSFQENVQSTDRTTSRLRGHHGAAYTDHDKGRPDDAELLLNLESDPDVPGWGWGDGGGMFFWIRKSDLKKADFSRVWGTIESG